MLATASFARSGSVPVAVTVAESQDTVIAFGVASGNAVEPPEYEYPVNWFSVTLAFPFAVTLCGIASAAAGITLQLDHTDADDDFADMLLALALPRGDVDCRITQAAGMEIKFALVVRGDEPVGYAPARYERSRY